MKNLYPVSANQQHENLILAVNSHCKIVNFRQYEDISDLMLEINNYCKYLGYPQITDIFDLCKSDWFALSFHCLNVKRNIDFFSLAKIIGMSM